MNNHKMDSTPKIITIIGLVLEVLNSVGLFVVAFLLGNVFNKDFLLQLEPNMPLEDVNFVLDLYHTMATVLYGMGGVLLAIFLVNIFIFGKLIRGKYSEQTAKKVYTYQFIWGIVNIFLNILVGILYIISGNQGKNGIVEMKETRHGI